MTVYIDESRPCYELSGYAVCCHMWTDGDESELHRFASRIGLKRSWFQDSNPRFHHYDLLGTTKREQAVKAGAVYMSLRVWIKASGLALSETTASRSQE